MIKMDRAGTILLFFILLLCLTAIGCGGGGGSEGGGSNPPTKAEIKIITSVTSSITEPTLGGVQAVIQLPDGVSVNTTTAPPQTDDGVVVASGVVSTTNSTDVLVLGIYAPGAGTVTIYVAKTTGFPTGEYATINCVIASGYQPKPSDFGIVAFEGRDLDSNIISGLTSTLQVKIY